MRLNPGITLAYADDVLRQAETTWLNARGEDLYRAYTDAVHDTYSTLKHAFAVPAVGAGLHSTAYWNVLPIGKTRLELSFVNDPGMAPNVLRALRAENQA